MRVYQHPTESRTFYAPDVAPSVDASLPILHVSGLDNFTVPQPLFRAIPLNQVTNLVPANGSGPVGLYQGNDFRNAYVPNVTLNGSGQTVALFELDGYYASDITEYESEAGLPAVPLQNISVDGFSGPNDPNGIVEVSLDIEMAISMAQGISKVIVYQGNNNGDFAIITDMLNQIATDNLAKQISSSWLLPDNVSWDQIYLEYAAQGQTFLQASGDNGAFDLTAQGQQRTDDPCTA